jgi:hypothetical protein
LLQAVKIAMAPTRMTITRKVFFLIKGTKLAHRKKKLFRGTEKRLRKAETFPFLALPGVAYRTDVVEFLIDVLLPKIELYCLQAGAAKTVAVISGDKGLFLIVHRDAIALAFKDIAHFAFKGGLAAATMFGFVLAHAVI